MFCVSKMRRMSVVLVGAVMAVILVSCTASYPTVREYLSTAPAGTTLVPAGKLKLNGRSARCGKHPAVMDPKFDDFGGAYPGFVILNPKRMKGLPTVVQFYIYSHECAHQTVGPDENAADCAAIRRGKREGWLNKAGVDQICKFMAPYSGDSLHLPGKKRCQKMRQCFANAGL